jgi:hypothetical protein
VLVWVLYTHGAAGSSDSGSLTVSLAETGDTITIPITATVVANPTVESSLVLDTSGSMSLQSGVATQTRMDVRAPAKSVESWSRRRHAETCR